MEETEGGFQQIISAAVRSALQEAFWHNQWHNNCQNMLLCWEDDNGEASTLEEHFLLCCEICHTYFSSTFSLVW